MGDMFKNSYSVTTLLGMVNQFHGLAGLSYVNRTDTTINTKRGVFASMAPDNPALANDDPPKMKYFGIGINGYYNVDDGVLSQPYYPLATNMDIYQPIPMRIVLASEEKTAISAAALAKLRMRTELTVEGVDYVAYWLKLIDFQDSEVQIEQIAPDGTQDDYVFDPTNLNPTPSKLTTPDLLETDGTSIQVSIEGHCSIRGDVDTTVGGDDSCSVREAINVLHDGDMRLARISEFGFYTGKDYHSDGDFTYTDSTPVVYDEAIYTQLAAHRCTNGTDLADPSSTHTEKIVFKNGSLVLL